MTGIEQHIIALISEHGYKAVALVSFTEGNALLILYGMIGASGLLNPFIMGAIFFVCDLISDTITFTIGRHGMPAIKKYSFTAKYANMLESHRKGVLNGKEPFSKTFPKIYAIVKFFAIPYGPILALLTAGLTGVSYKRFLGSFFLIEPIKIFIFMTLGYRFGKLIRGHENAFALALGGIGIFLIIGFFVIRFVRKRLVQEFPNL